MKLASLCFRITVLVTLALGVPVSQAPAQQQDSTLSAATIEAFAAAHLAVLTMRGKMQAELADPRAKKAEVQIALREKLQANTDRVLKEHRLTATEFSRLTRRVSTDDVVRKQFDEAVTRLSRGTPAG